MKVTLKYFLLVSELNGQQHSLLEKLCVCAQAAWECTGSVCK